MLATAILHRLLPLQSSCSSARLGSRHWKLLTHSPMAWCYWHEGLTPSRAGREFFTL